MAGSHGRRRTRIRRDLWASADSLLDLAPANHYGSDLSEKAAATVLDMDEAEIRAFVTAEKPVPRYLISGAPADRRQERDGGSLARLMSNPEDPAADGRHFRL